MALLDFIKNRKAQQPVAEQQSPETFKQMNTRQALEDSANRVAPTADQEKRAREIGDAMRGGNQPSQQTPPATDMPGDQGANSAHLQKQNNQDKTQAAMSPTDGVSGKTALQENVTSPSQDKAADRSQKTLPRTTPSWER